VSNLQPLEAQGQGRCQRQNVQLLEGESLQSFSTEIREAVLKQANPFLGGCQSHAQIHDVSPSLGVDQKVSRPQVPMACLRIRATPLPVMKVTKA
jgi:hypothetical protein